MKKAGCWLGLWFASLTCVFAQITVEVSQDQDQFLPGEALPVAVRITNRSGQTLHLGNNETWLTFSVESRDGVIINRLGNVPVDGEFALDSSKRATKRVDLAPYFNLVTPGRYTITATLNIKEWNQHITSDAKPFDIIQGSKMWEQVVGLPKTAGSTNEVPELRRYALHQANYLRKNLMLYVQVTGANGKIYKVFPIGPMLSIGQPEPQVDKFSNLHVLYQNGPRSFNYYVINPDGDILTRQTYDYTTRPRLKESSEGRIVVNGGSRRITANDVPPAAIPDETPPAPAPGS